MKRPFVILGSVIILALASSSTAHAVLIDRGYGLIYDTELNITWLQDANYARTQGLGGTDPAFPLGQFTWAEAMAWADNLVYAGYSDWRLPTTLVPDLSCAFFESTGYNCTGSEMGHLYYIDGIRTGNSGPFFNVGLSDYYYWSSTEFGAGGAYSFSFWSGHQEIWTEVRPTFIAWAVRDGTVPEPATIWLLGLGLAGVILARRLR